MIAKPQPYELTPQRIEEIRLTAPKQPAATPRRGRRVLMFYSCKGFQHWGAPHTSAMLRALAETSGAFQVVETANVADRGATIDAVLAHPLFVDAASAGKKPVPPRLSSYQAVALSLLGKEAIPQFLEPAKAVLAAGEKSKVKVRGAPLAPPVRYGDILELASAAYTIDPKSATDFLPLVAQYPLSGQIDHALNTDVLEKGISVGPGTNGQTYGILALMRLAQLWETVRTVKEPRQ